MDWLIWSIVPSNENLFESLIEMEKFGKSAGDKISGRRIEPQPQFASPMTIEVWI
jgi:hypothetical protein